MILSWGGRLALSIPHERRVTWDTRRKGWEVQCRCGATVALTNAGRPRNHNVPDNGPCTIPRDDYELPDCRYCGGSAYVPIGRCVRRPSPLYHPETWTYRGFEVGNAATAGELVGVTGPQYQWLAKIPPEGPRRAPGHRGVRKDGVRFYDLAAVREFTRHRPGPGWWR